MPNTLNGSVSGPYYICYRYKRRRPQTFSDHRRGSWCRSYYSELRNGQMWEEAATHTLDVHDVGDMPIHRSLNT